MEINNLKAKLEEYDKALEITATKPQQEMLQEKLRVSYIENQKNLILLLEQKISRMERQIENTLVD